MNPHGRTIRCKHYDVKQSTLEKTCAVGVDIPSLPKSDNYPPCVWGARQDKPGGCDKQEFPSDEEIAADKKRTIESFARVATCLEAIQEKEGDNRGVVGKLPCPVCKTGTLGYSIAASNGHIWGKCSTPECVAWMM